MMFLENVDIFTVDKLCETNDGYPAVTINGKHRKCHELSLMTFRPREYAAKLPGDIILHKKDNKLDFNPFRLRWGTPPENGIGAHRNGKHDNTKRARKPVTSYIDDVLEQEHESLRDAAKYLKINGYSKARDSGIRHALKNNVTRYDRTWKLVYP